MFKKLKMSLFRFLNSKVSLLTACSAFFISSFVSNMSLMNREREKEKMMQEILEKVETMKIDIEKLPPCEYKMVSEPHCEYKISLEEMNRRTM